MPAAMPMRFVFSCSAHVGHLNPTLPLVRALVDLGHEVHFVCFEMARAKIESAGGTFHDAQDVQTELYASRKADGHSPKDAIFILMEELGLEMSFLNVLKVLNVAVEMELPGTLRFLREMRPDVVVYDPLIAARAFPLAAKALGVPAVGLLTVAGPGSLLEHGPPLLEPLTLEEAGRLVQEFAPHLAATERINADYGLALKPTHLLPDGWLDTCLSNTVIVTTTEELQDPATPAMAQAYKQDGTSFAFVGPMLMPPVPRDGAVEEDPVVRRVREARAAGRTVVVVSMGTVVTGGDKVVGWDATCNGKSSLTGRDLCRAAWAGVFDACGAAEPDSGALIIAALGLQPDALGHVTAPPNAVCVPSFAQVELLRAGIDLFVTHGGQNSFTEILSCGTPVVVCPGFGDQIVNAAKAVTLGVGLKVDRPRHSEEESAAAAARYQRDVCEAVSRVLADAACKEAAELQAQRLRSSGGVPGAVELVLKAAGSRPKGAAEEPAAQRREVAAVAGA
mmetsp:Transcript_29904/g.85815  ORF Transcript_29904/g.85815 Transcript_29904/m.85815 type:complete len:507 (-) Transcript_29904:241-1761(-)